MRAWRYVLVAALAAAAVTVADDAALAAPAAQPVAAAQPASAGSVYTPVSPVRVLDTRSGAAVGPGRTVILDLSSRLPASATAAVLNVTGVAPTAPTFVTVFPHGEPRPTASHLNLAAGETRPNLVTVAVPADRRLALYNNAGSVHLLADLAGYYATGAGSRFTALTPQRLTPSFGIRLGPGQTGGIELYDRVPGSATAVTFNLTATDVTAATFVTAWPSFSNRPAASNLNLVAGDTRANLVTVAIGPGRGVSLFNNAGSVALHADLVGFYTPDYGATFTPLSPSRVLDTRNGTGTGGSTAPVGPQGEIALDLPQAGTAATAIAMNLTGVGATAPTYVTVWPGTEQRPPVSSLNVAPGQTVPNHVVSAFDRATRIKLYNNAGSVHLVADLAGVFTVSDPPCVDDCVLSWGWNIYGQLGTGRAVPASAQAAPVAGLSGVTAVAGAWGFTGYALLADGTVRAWGENGHGELGNGWAGESTSQSAVPVPVVGLNGVVAIEAGGRTGYALRDDGTVWAWGDNGLGQLGTDFRGYHHYSLPVRVAGLTQVTVIASMASRPYALRSDGTVWSWYGQTPDPEQVPGLTSVTAIAGGWDTAYALRADGTVWAWGSNRDGALGNGTGCSAVCRVDVPVQVSGLTGVTSIAGGESSGYAIRGDGTAWAWGNNRNGNLGIGVECDPSTGTGCESRVPVQISGLTSVARMASLNRGAYALLGDGTVWAWGNNHYGQLGTGFTGPHSTVPVPVSGLTGVRAIARGSFAARVLGP